MVKIKKIYFTLDVRFMFNELFEKWESKS